MQARHTARETQGQERVGLPSVEGDQAPAQHKQLPSPPRIPKRRHCKHPGNEKHNQTNSTDPGMKPHTRVKLPVLHQTALNTARGPSTFRQTSTDRKPGKVRGPPADSRSTFLSHSLFRAGAPEPFQHCGPFPWRMPQIDKRFDPGPSRREGTHGPRQSRSLSDNPMTAVPATPRRLGQ